MFWLKKKNYLCRHSYSVDYSLHTKHFAMKKKILSLMAAVAMLGMFASCSSDDPKQPEIDPPTPPEVVVPGQDIPANEYKGEDVHLTMGDAAVAGQIVKFVPGTEPKLIIESEPINLSELIAGAAAQSKADGDIMLPTPGLIPGSPSVIIPLTLTGEADTCSFTGNTQTDYCTFNYTGAVGPNGVTLKISDVKLKNTSLAGTYAVPTDYVSENNTLDISRLFRLKWDSTEKIIGLPAGQIIGIALQFVTQPNADGVAQPLPVLYANVLKNVTFGEDGSVTATYRDTDKDGWPEATAPRGIASYVVKEDGTALVFINPTAVIANVAANASKSRAIDMDAIMEALINDVLPMCQNGVPVNYGPALVDTWTYDENANQIFAPSDNPNAYSFYLGTDLLLPLLKLAAPILTDDSVVNMIVEAAQKDPNMGFLASMIPSMLESVPKVIETTTCVELGINLDRQ